MIFQPGEILCRYSDAIMRAMASQTTGVSIVCLNLCSGAGQRKHQSSASLAFVRGIYRWPVKGPVTRKCFHLMTSSCIYLFVTTVTGRPFWQTPGASIAIISALSGWCHRKSQLSAAPRILRKKGNNLTSNVSWTCAEIYLALHKIKRTMLY